MKPLLALLFVPLAATGQNEKAYLLKPHHPKTGEVVSIRSSSVSKGGKMILRQGDESTEGAMSVQRSRSLEHRSMTRGEATGLSYKILEDVTVTSNELGIPEKNNRHVSTLTGETVAGYLDTMNRWHLYIEGKSVFSSGAVELAGLEAYANRQWFVDRPVKVGESWPIDPSFIRHLAVRDLEDVELQATMTLKEVKDINGTSTAVLAFKLQSIGVRGKAPEQSAATGSINATGTVLVSLDTMLDRDLRLEGTLQSTARSGNDLATVVLPFSVHLQKTVARR